LHDGDVYAAHAEGLRCRPVQQTVSDTWEWLHAEGGEPASPRASELGLDPAVEQRILDRHR